MSEPISKFGVPPSHEAIVYRMEAWSCQGKDYPATEEFDEELAVAYLIMRGVLFVNSSWYEKDWPDEARNSVRLLANCNDVFAWGCADAEAVEYDDIRAIYEHYRKDSSWGVAVWACKKRNMMPQKPVAKRITESGLWRLDDMGLRPNE